MKQIKTCILLCLFTSPLFSQNKDETEVTQKVEVLRKAMISADSVQLNELVSKWLSYGHSNNVVENKRLFISSLVSGKYDFTNIQLTDQTISVNKNIAIVRHKLVGTTQDEGMPPREVKLGVLLVWKKTRGTWQLIARQACKL